jgi:molybdenum cofactor cytidylyltransferase
LNGVFTLGVVILAAGASTRMGRPKLLLPWNNTSILGHLIDRWRQLGARHIGVVYASGRGEVETELDRLQFPVPNRILNPQPERGMFGSLQCAARWPQWETGLTHWAIVLGDQPHVRLATLRQLLDWAAAHPESICQPARQGRPKHPVLLPKILFEQLPATPAQNFRQFLQSAPGHIQLCESADAGLDLDLDEPADYARALQLPNNNDFWLRIP